MAVKLGTIMGFPIEIDWSWFIVFLLMVVGINGGLLGSVHPTQYSSLMLLAAGVVGALLFFASLLGHELAHCWVARQFGIPIAGITLFIFGGVARMKDEPARPMDELKMALAGPCFSILMSVFFYLVWGARILQPLWAEVAWYLTIGNLVVAIFNLVPAFPSDGGRALRAILWSWTGNYQSATRVASRLGQAFGWVLMGLGVTRFLVGDLGGIWYIFIGLFLQNAAQSAYQQVQWRKAMSGLLVRDVMNSSPVAIPPDVTLENAVHEYFMRDPSEALPVAVDGEVQGILRIPDIREVPSNDWAATLVRAVMSPAQPGCIVNPDSEAWDALAGAGQSCQPPLLVVADGKLVGTVTQEALARQIQLRMHLRT